MRGAAALTAVEVSSWSHRKLRVTVLGLGPRLGLARHRSADLAVRGHGAVHAHVHSIRTRTVPEWLPLLGGRLVRSWRVIARFSMPGEVAEVEAGRTRIGRRLSDKARRPGCTTTKSQAGRSDQCRSARLAGATGDVTHDALGCEAAQSAACRNRSSRSAKPGAAATKWPAPGATTRSPSNAVARASQMRSIPAA